jgi:signal peptidase I
MSMSRPRLRRHGLIYEIVETIVLLVSIYALADLASVRFYVDGPSMEPSFYTGQRVIVSRVNYMIGDPQRGDIMVFHSPQSPADSPPLIKRVIGLPGETVEIRDQQVYVDGGLLNESYINELNSTSGGSNSQVMLGPNQYYVMGDNRNHSRDSRFFGPVSRSAIIGEALVRYWPPQDWALLHGLRLPDSLSP